MASRPVATPSLDFRRAARRIGSLAWVTPLVPLELDGGPPAWLKLESLQRTGSFKFRGAANRLAMLDPGERRRGVVTCSSGNHGRAVAEASRQLGVQATVCVPDWVDPLKRDAIEAAGARVVHSGPAYDDAEARAATLAETRGLVLVHPFDDPLVIEGQGTVGLEILDHLPDVAEVIVPLSGGGLVAGIAAAVRPRGIRVIAVSADRASVMYESVVAGHPVQHPDQETVASALSGGIGLENRHTFEMVRAMVSEHVVVSEQSIRAAVARAFLELHLVVEGGGAVGLAALWSGYRPRGPVAVVVSGGNIDSGLLVDLVGGAAG